MSEGLEVWRCPSCSRILAKLRLAPGSVVEVKCGSCNALSTREPDPMERMSVAAASQCDVAPSI